MTNWTEPATPIAATFSKDPRFFAKDFVPTEVHEGVASHVYGGGSYYIDWISALGANLCGYPGLTEPAMISSISGKFTQRVSAQLWQGAGFSLPHFLEAHVAEKIVNLLGRRVPGWTPAGLGVRFGLSGTDATSMAVRLARAVTGRTRILSFGYHGWSDVFVGATPPAWGVPKGQRIESFNWNDKDGLADLMSKNRKPVAAIIVEHPMQEAAEGWYDWIKHLCWATGALFILDEVVTWPRFSRGGAAELYGIEPDLICLGKGLGNGLPISCIVGRREYFDWFSRNDPCFVSSTHFGNAVSLAAAAAVLDLFGDEQVAHIWRIGEALMDGLQEIGFKVIGHPPRFLIDFPPSAEGLSQKTYFTLAMRDRGVLANRPWLPNCAHTLEDVERTIAAAREIKAEMATVDVEALMADRLPMVLFSNR